MSWEKSAVMVEFMKIAQKQNLLGMKKVASDKVQENPYQEDLKTIEEKRQKSPEKHIVEQAHPEPVYVAEARGDGGLVENQLEQQQKLIEMINKMPTGSIVGRYATIVSHLVKLADRCDNNGDYEASDKIMKVVELVNNSIEKELPLA